jgi:AcrR family transcriptional regulator
VDAAIETLKSDGYAGASARSIAQRAGLNQGLIFYHFGSVANLLLAALDSVSEERLRLYGAEVSGVTGPVELVDAAEGFFRNDLSAGYITVLVEMIAGSSATPGLGPAVASRIQPWREFAQSAVERALGDSPLGSVLPAKDVAHAVVALYLGLEMLSHLDGDAEPALALFAHAHQLASLVEGLIAPTTSEESA